MATKKLTFQFGDRLAEALEKLAEAQGVPKVEVIRRALALYAYADEQARNGNRLAIRDPQGQRFTDIVLMT